MKSSILAFLYCFSQGAAGGGQRSHNNSWNGLTDIKQSNQWLAANLTIIQLWKKTKKWNMSLFWLFTSCSSFQYFHLVFFFINNLLVKKKKTWFEDASLGSGYLRWAFNKKINKNFFSRIVTKQQTNKKKNQPFNLIIQKNSNLSLKEMINKQLGFKLIEG